jgi:hypothetical protein
MWIAIQCTQDTAGVGVVLADAGSWRFLPHAVGQWCSSLHDFLADSECTLEIADVYTEHSLHPAGPRPYLHGGRNNRTSAQKARMQTINRCRLYLQVECLSDVCTADGPSMDPGLQAQAPKATS